MLDKRTIFKQHEEISQDLLNLTDTEIVLEFSKILTLIYPSLVKLEEHCYDTFDVITESLYFDTIYSAFSGKYGAVIAREETHKYGFSLHCYHKLNHINITPKEFPTTILSTSGIEMEITEDFFKTKELVFIDFGDTVNFFSADKDNIDLKSVNFDYSRLAIVDKNIGLTFKDEDQYWIINSNVEFELVLEDYSKDEHQFYKIDLYADTIDTTKLENNEKKNKWKFWK
jgi:hypothetical protein